MVYPLDSTTFPTRLSNATVCINRSMTTYLEHPTAIPPPPMLPFHLMAVHPIISFPLLSLQGGGHRPSVAVGCRTAQQRVARLGLGHAAATAGRHVRVAPLLRKVDAKQTPQPRETGEKHNFMRLIRSLLGNALKLYLWSFQTPCKSVSLAHSSPAAAWKDALRLTLVGAGACGLKRRNQ